MHERMLTLRHACAGCVGATTRTTAPALLPLSLALCKASATAAYHCSTGRPMCSARRTNSKIDSRRPRACKWISIALPSTLIVVER